MPSASTARRTLSTEGQRTSVLATAGGRTRLRTARWRSPPHSGGFGTDSLEMDDHSKALMQQNEQLRAQLMRTDSFSVGQRPVLALDRLIGDQGPLVVSSYYNADFNGFSHDNVND